jgi:TPP-dependent pyruvate/acetoin dehydrogenase alpha subunit
MCEIMGKEGALLSGKGGSQHIHCKNFYSSGILGGMFPIAAGSALAQKIKNNAYIGIGVKINKRIDIGNNA